MVIDNISVYHSVDPDLRVEIIVWKEEATGNGGIDFEIGDMGTSAHWYLWLKKISCRACLRFYYFFGDKKCFLTALLTSTFIRSLLNSFDLPSYSWKSTKRYKLRLLFVDVSRSAWIKVFLFSWKRLARGL